VTADLGRFDRYPFLVLILSITRYQPLLIVILIRAIFTSTCGTELCTVIGSMLQQFERILQ